MNLHEYFLELAQIEENASRLYLKFSKECSEKLKSVLISISKEEAKHKKIMFELSSNEDLKEKQINKYLEDILQKQFNYIYSNNKLKLTYEKDLFVFALQLEKNSIEIYTKLLCIFEVDSYGHKETKYLIKEERKHMIYILNKLYEMK